MFEMIACSSIIDPWASVSYFQKGAPEQVDVHEGTWEGFWSMITGRDHQRRNTIRNRLSKCVTFVQVDFWENERDKDNQHGVELALLGFFPRIQSTPLTYDQLVVL
jgi:hypothetical protein